MIKKALLASVLFPLLLPHLFAQPKYFNSTQIALMMGNRQIPFYYYPSYLSSSYALPYYYSETQMQVIPSVTMTNGIMFNNHWAAGIGVGVEIFDRNLFPIFADIRYTLWDNKISPFFAAKGGYALSSFKKIDNIRKQGGLMLHPEMGVKISVNEKADLLFTVAYRYQKTKSTQRYEYTNFYYDEWIRKERLNRLSIGVAIMFK